MITIYPEKDCVLRNNVNGVFSFMASTSYPENWENVSISEYHSKPEPLTDEEALTRYANTLTGANDQTLVEAAETLITERIKEE